MAIPPHANLARFVTFDAGARAEADPGDGARRGARRSSGSSSRARSTCRAALQLLDDVLAGLEAMHEVGVGHLDSSRRTSSCAADEEAVLVDFGLAGRDTSVPGARPGRTVRPRSGGRSTEAELRRAGGHLRVRLRRVRDADRAGPLRGGQRAGADRAPRRARRHPRRRCKRSSVAPTRRRSVELLHSALRREPEAARDGEAAARASEGASVQDSTVEVAAGKIDIESETGALAPIEGEPDPDGADCVACGRCCHHGPKTVHLLESGRRANGGGLARAVHGARRPRTGAGASCATRGAAAGRSTRRSRGAFRARSTSAVRRIAGSSSRGHRAAWRRGAWGGSGRAWSFGGRGEPGLV